MENPFDDLTIELINHFSDTHGRTFAHSFDEFITKVVHCINQALAETSEGQELIRSSILRSVSAGKTPEEWKKEYINILAVFFFMILDAVPMLKHEFARHCYDLLRKENL